MRGFLLLLFSWLCLSLLGEAPSIQQVVIQESGEPLVDLRQQTIIAYASALEFVSDGSNVKVRKTVYEKLQQAQALLPEGTRLYLYEGWRSAITQNKLFEALYQQNQKKFPSLTPQQLFAKTSKLVAPVKQYDGTPNIPSHSTGGAIDICLIDTQGHFLDMGIDMSCLFEIDPELMRTEASALSKEVKANRALLAKVLSAVGFVNYPAEFWHWSYGDRRWALATHAPYAIYGAKLE